MTKYIQYCTHCVMPETKPDLYIDEQGVCSACRNLEKRQEVDWPARKKELLDILKRYRSKNSSNYDCIIPVSGGKDSHFQVLKILEMGMNPLCVTATTDKLSDIGRRNIENLKNLGLDYIEVTTNPLVRSNINRLALTEIGDISWPEHVTIFTIPVRLAVQLNIPLIIWGENPQNEYGGPAAAGNNNSLTRRWLEEFGGLLGLRVTDLIGQEGIEPQHLIQYTYPSDEDLQRVGVTGLFLGYYLPWDGYQNALYAQAHGFETYHKSIEGSLVNYENLDNYQTGIHDYFKFLKYGFGRATDLACLHIRRGRLGREEAIKLVKMHDGKFPWIYLGCPLEEILKDIDMTVEEFIQVCDRFTNKKLFLCDSRGNLVKDKQGNLSKINYDNIIPTSELDWQLTVNHTTVL
ncbi:N-acetyl sugar amidotransferase [Nostoc sp.]|uniref:N-acetyl sugar amidotransferase n=1 Tax=Nostoc sp. TaxID=1180 RepID=UPI002FF8F0DE